MTTWQLNRTFTLKIQAYRRPHTEFLRYLVVSALGFAIKLSVFWAVVASAYRTKRYYPVLALEPTFLTDPVINHLDVRHFVFGTKVRVV